MVVQALLKTMIGKKDEIERQSVVLRGRYRWSICYIEGLFKTCILREDLDNQLISEASEIVKKAAKEPLKRRIDSLATSADIGRQKLANDVFHMAIQANLYGRSRILDTEDAAILIEQALGYVERVSEGKAKVCLAERLVVDSVMEHLIEKASPGDITDQYLDTWQYSASSFGFITEDRLGEAIYTFANETYDETKRNVFLSHFDNVYNIAPTSIQKPGSIRLNLGDFFLEQNPGSVAVSLGGHRDAVHWLKQVVEGLPRPLFCYPARVPGRILCLCSVTVQPHRSSGYCAPSRYVAISMYVLKLTSAVLQS